MLRCFVNNALFPLTAKKTMQTVLIAAEGAGDNLLSRGYFDAVITRDDLYQ